MPEKKWKRPLLFILSFIGLVGGGYLFYISKHLSSNDPFTIILALVCGAFLLLGLVVSAVGCNRCVAKLFGNV